MSLLEIFNLFSHQFHLPDDKLKDAQVLKRKIEMTKIPVNRNYKPPHALKPEILKKTKDLIDADLIRLNKFDYNIVYRPGAQISNV